MRYVNVSRARAELPTLVDSSDRTVITRNGRPVAVLLSVADFRALRATADLAKEPARAAEILRLHEQVQRGDFSGFRRMDLDETEAPSAGKAHALRDRAQAEAELEPPEERRYPEPETSPSELREAHDPAADPTSLEQRILRQVHELLAALRAELNATKPSTAKATKRTRAAAVKRRACRSSTR
jgi:prevent-host-death family protein